MEQVITTDSNCQSKQPGFIAWVKKMLSGKAVATDKKITSAYLDEISPHLKRDIGLYK